MFHPSEELLRRFALGLATRRENREVEARLLQGCPRCAEVLARGLRYHFDQDQEAEGGIGYFPPPRRRISRALSDDSDDGGFYPPGA